MNTTTEPGIGTEEWARAAGDVVPLDDAAVTLDHKTYPPPPPSIRNKRGTTDWRKLEMEAHPIFANELMTRSLLTVGPNDLLERLEEQMQAFRFRHLPVVEDDKLVGLIAYADLLRVSSTTLSDKAKERDELIHKLPVSAVMQRDLLTVRPTATLMEVAALMWSTRVGCVPVTEQDNTLVGIITEADFIRVAHHFLAPLSPRDPGSAMAY